MTLPIRMNSRKTHLEKLESRQLLTTFYAEDAVIGDDVSDYAQIGVFAKSQHAALSAEQILANESALLESQQLTLPVGLPAKFSVEVEYAGETLTLQLDKNSIFGENTRFLIDDGSGNLVQVDHGEDRSYLGTLIERPDYSVSAVLTEAGLHAKIIRPGQTSITIEPFSENTTVGQHRVFVEAEAPASHNHDHNGDGIPDHAPEDHTDETGGGHPPGCTCAACCGLTSDESEVSALTPSAASGEGGPFSERDPNVSATTLPPSRTIDVREYEVGVEIGSAALLNNYNGSTTQAKVNHAMSVAQTIPGNLDARFLRAAGIKHRLGTVIIRTGSDPFNVAHGNDSAGLSAFRNYWNNNPQEVGTTHDLAVYHVRASPSGLAYVNSVGGSFRYALSASNGATSWADGTLAHEFGHSWSLGHVPSGTTSSAGSYEAKPRSNGNVAGGIDDFISIMHGSGDHNIGRLSTGEASRVLGAKQNKLQFGDVVANEPQVAPFGWADSVVANGGGPVTIDVIANDHDANNDVLDVQLRDTVSFLGGTISLSQNTGPGGRNEVIYTPPAALNGTDFFHYTVVDSTGRTDWGAVYVTSTEVTVDLSQNFYSYDLGTPTSPVFSSSTVQAVRVSHETTGDITWSRAVLSEDRANSGQNDYNRDYVRGFQDTTWSHKIAAGTWRVTLNMSAPDFAFDNMFVNAEGVRKVSNIDRPIGVNTTFSFDVSVSDGFLDLTFGDDDSSDKRWAVNRINLTRIGAASVTVDLNATEYRYDFGTEDSAVETNYQRITPSVSGDISFSSSVSAQDENAGVGNLHRDYVSSSALTTFEHRIANGTWRVTATMGSAWVPRTEMTIAAEGNQIANFVSSLPGEYREITFDTTVTDDSLSLTFEDVTSPPLGTVISESAARVVFEAENFSNRSAGLGLTWEVLSDTGASEGLAVVAGPENTGAGSGSDLTGPRLDYEIDFANPGTYQVYVRTLGPDPASDSMHLGLNGISFTNSSGNGLGDGSGSWVWVDDVNRGTQNVTVNVPTAGRHTFNIWMREDGVQVDKVVLQQTGSTPNGFGPANSSFIRNDPNWVLNALTITRVTENANFNSDAQVDGFDFLAWQRGFGNSGSATLTDGDANGDQSVDASDLSVWLDQYGTVSAQISSQPTNQLAQAFVSPLLSTNEASLSAAPQLLSPESIDAAMAVSANSEVNDQAVVAHEMSFNEHLSFLPRTALPALEVLADEPSTADIAGHPDADHQFNLWSDEAVLDALFVKAFWS